MAKPDFDWRSAAYGEWNLRLLDYFLGEGPTGEVETLPATREELVLIAGGPQASGDEVATAFCDAVRAALPRGTSFCGFCRDDAWSPDVVEPPHFFGMLWFTCLVAAGYPEPTGQFSERVRGILGKADNLRYSDEGGCLEDLWEQLAEWTRSRPERPTLVLPPPDDRLRVIGRSHYLAFPNGRDRRRLAEILAAEELTGLEPAIEPVVRTLLAARGRFSEDFQEALDHFLENFLHRARDPAESPFWRAIRATAIRDARVEEQESGSARSSLLAEWDDDDTLLVRVVCADTESGPLGGPVHSLPLPVEEYTHYEGSGDGDPDFVVAYVLEAPDEVAPAIRNQVRRGVLVFAETVGGMHLLASGEEVNGARVALVRDDRVAAFIDPTNGFGGYAHPSRFARWCEVEGCSVRQVSTLPPGLEDATHLLHTTAPPRPRLVGGVRIGKSFLHLAGLLPRVRAVGADTVVARCGERELPCTPTDEPGLWTIPEALLVEIPCDVEVVGRWTVDIGGGEFAREGRRSFRLEALAHGVGYKPPSSGAYWRESCAAAQRVHQGSAAVPLDISTGDPSRTVDLLRLDPTIRFLGPGCGEMALEPRPDHQWFATGSKGSPTHLVFVGDLGSVVPPDDAESPDKGDRRAWKKAFSSAKHISAYVQGRYLAAEDDRRLEDAVRLYRRRASGGGRGTAEREVAPLGLGAIMPEGPRFGVGPSRVASQVVEALAALGARRSGIPLKQFRDDLVARMAPRRDYVLWQQVTRGWLESGHLDLLRRQDQSQTIVVPRPPQFVMVRRGPLADATLFGLVPARVRDAVWGEARRRRIDVEPLCSPSEHQPEVLRLLETEPEHIAEIASVLGLGSPEWLAWDRISEAPPHLRVGPAVDGLPAGGAGDAYRSEAVWDWEATGFVRREPSGGVEVARGFHPRRCAVYVVQQGDRPALHCHLRTWALLRASELLGKPPFRMTAEGILVSDGPAPLNLPLPLARLCVALGIGLPGPEVGTGRGVSAYLYPFGRPVQALLAAVLPSAWLDQPPRTDD